MQFILSEKIEVKVKMKLKNLIIYNIQNNDSSNSSKRQIRKTKRKAYSFIYYNRHEIALKDGIEERSRRIKLKEDWRKYSYEKIE